jgi:DNA primase
VKVGTITDELLDRILEENDLREVAEEYGVVFGANNKAICPFHKESTPSLHLHTENNTYHCYACRAGTRWENKEKRIPHMLHLPDGVTIEDGGPSVIGFVMNMERCSYIEACVILMERAGIPIPKAKVDAKLEKMKQKMTEDNKLFCKTLLKSEKMLAYLDSRGIHRDAIKKWRIGLVPKGYRHPYFGTLLEGRLVFGITEPCWNPKKAKTIAMAYRDMNYEKGSKDHSAKYINDKESEIYKKGQILYGLNEARKAIREAGYALVVEGYTDVIIAHQCGIENTIATCGTSFTDEQMDILEKLTKNIYFWYDGDEAGREAMERTIGRLLARGFKVYVIISTPRDPAEQMNYMGQKGKAIRRYIADKAIPARMFLASSIFEEYDKKLQRLKADMLDELMPIYRLITDDTEKVLFKSMIQERLGVQI